MNTNTGFLRKYLTLIVAIVIFFALSIGIFSFNFYASEQFGSDAAKINDSGRLRGLTQQFAKAVLSLSQEITSGDPIQTSQAQISESMQGIETLLQQAIERTDAEDREESDLITRIRKSWDPVAPLAAGVVKEGPPDTESVDALRQRSNATNVRLLQASDDLTQHLETRAAARAERLKMVQAGAILLALINFLFIVFHAFRSLARSDQLANAAREETEQILGAVREGLFLIDREGVIGKQRSGKLAAIFPRPLPAGEKLMEVLTSMVSEETMESVRNYVGLLFNKRVKPALIESLNPLHRVEISMPEKGPGVSIYLSLGFTPVHDLRTKSVNAMLVSVVDVSQEVYLERELLAAEERASNDMALLLGVLDNDPAVVGDFLDGATNRLNALNNRLKDLDPRRSNYLDAINDVFRIVHSIKGEASSLALTPVAQRAHAFEDVLVPLRRKEITGGDLIPVATGIGGMLHALDKVRRVTSKISQYAQTENSAATSGTKASADEDAHHTLHRIQRMALAVAAELDKKIRVETALDHLDVIPESIQRLLREGLPQLVRNAIVHGIEQTEEREKQGKRPEGLIRIELKKPSDNVFEVLVSDDGRGIDPNKLRRKLIAMGKFSAQQVNEMSDRDVVAVIFQPGFSTVDTVDNHAGRGFGLDVLLGLVRSTGARIRVASQPQVATTFTLQWSLNT